jgi:hypothetical protein
MIPLFVLPFTLLVVLTSSTSGDHLFHKTVTLCRPPHQDWGRARTAGNRFARDNKELESSLLALHTSGPRDVPRCGALSLLQKDAALQGGIQQKPL